MLFYTFEGLFRKKAPELSINDRFYEGISINFSGCFKTLFYQCFFDVLQSRQTPSTFTDKHNGFCINFGSFFENGIKKYPFSTGFIRVSRMVIPHVLKHYRTNAFLVFCERLGNQNIS